MFPASFSFHLEDNVNKNTSLDLISQVAAPKISWVFEEYQSALSSSEDGQIKQQNHIYLIWTKEIN